MAPTLATLLVATAMAAESDTTPTLGMAGAGGANPLDEGALRRSPAAMMLGVAYSARVDARLGEGVAASGVLRDTRTSNLGAGVMYTHQWVVREPDAAQLPGWVIPDAEPLMDAREERAVRLGLGYGFKRTPLVGSGEPTEIRRFALGAGLVYDRDTSSLDGLTQGVDLDLSVAGRPVAPLCLSLSARDLLPTGPRAWSAELGAWATPTPALAFGADLRYDATPGASPLGARLGGQALISGVVPLRAGWAVDGGGDGGFDHRLALGAGAQSDKAALDYALVVRGVGADAPGLTHTLGFSARF